MINFSSQNIKRYCGSASYEKGEKCARLDNFSKIFVQDDALFGLYQGSVGTYKINIVFENNNPQYAWCSCPAMSQYDDKCKHIAAILILWNISPREFIVLESWSNLLKNKDKKDLIKLIVSSAARSIEMTNTLYEELKDETILDGDELYDPEDEW